MWAFSQEGELDEFWENHSIGTRRRFSETETAFLRDRSRRFVQAIEPVLRFLEEGFGSEQLRRKPDEHSAAPGSAELRSRFERRCIFLGVSKCSQTRCVKSGTPSLGCRPPRGMSAPTLNCTTACGEGRGPECASLPGRVRRDRPGHPIAASESPDSVRVFPVLTEPNGTGAGHRQSPL